MRLVTCALSIGVVALSEYIILKDFYPTLLSVMWVSLAFVATAFLYFPKRESNDGEPAPMQTRVGSPEITSQELIRLAATEEYRAWLSRKFTAENSLRLLRIQRRGYLRYGLTATLVSGLLIATTTLPISGTAVLLYLIVAGVISVDLPEALPLAVLATSALALSGTGVVDSALLPWAVFACGIRIFSEMYYV